MEALKTNIFNSNKFSDNLVVQRIIAGEKELYEILLRRYNQTLYRAIRSYLKDELDIEDAMQETYFKAYQKLHQIRGEAKFSTWLIRIGINEYKFSNDSTIFEFGNSKCDRIVNHVMKRI